MLSKLLRASQSIFLRDGNFFGLASTDQGFSGEIVR